MKKLLIIAITIVALAPFACKKDSGSSGQPMVTGVRSMDTTKRDSLFTEAVPGTLIVIEGNNFNGLQAVYFDDTSAYFNPSYVTSTNIIITIPSTAQTSATNPNVKDIIRIVTDHGETSYAFSLYLPPPQIYSLSFDNSGSVVYINGTNFEGLKKITFPINGGTDTALSYEVSKDYKQITAEIPPGIPYTDSIRVYCTYGTAAYSYPPPMSITSVSNENGAGGTSITITGTNFIGIDKVIFPGGLEGSNIQIKDVNDLSVTVPSSITTTDSLRVQGVLGLATAPQLYASYITHPSPGYLSSFDQQWAGDNTSFVGWTGGYADAPTASESYPIPTSGTGVLLQSSPMAANAGPTSQGNPGLLQLNDVPWISSTSTSIADYAMKFEIYVASPWSAGQIWIAVGDWYGWSSYTARYAPWEDDPNKVFQPSGWVTVTIPLTEFISGNQFWQTSWSTAGSPASKFSDYPSTAVVFMIANDLNAAVPAKSINVAIDNVRIVKVK